MSDKEEVIKRYYYDPQLGFQSASKLFKKIKEDGHEVTYKDVRNFINRQEVHQLTKRTQEPKQFNTITASYPLENVQMDIMVYDRFAFPFL